MRRGPRPFRPGLVSIAEAAGLPRATKDGRCITGKRRLPDMLTAIDMLLYAVRRPNEWRNRTAPFRAYACDRGCQGWHLTAHADRWAPWTSAPPIPRIR